MAILLQVNAMIKLKRIEHDVRKRFPKIAEVLSKYPEVVVAYVFGSYAKGDVGPLSDVDIAYLFDPTFFEKPDHLKLDLRISAEIAMALGTDEVYCYLLSKAPLPFQHEVITTGKVIYCRDPSLKERYERGVKEAYERRKHEFEVSKRDFLRAFKG